MTVVSSTESKTTRASPALRRKRARVRDPLHVIFVASECFPFVKTGGLADVTASLPKELALLGHRVEIFLPLYLKALLYPIDNGVKIAPSHDFEPVQYRIDGYSFRSRIYSTHMPDAPVAVHLVDSEFYEYFTSRSAMSSPYSWTDNFGRFAFFSKVVATVNAHRGERPHVVHAHDWPTGLVPVWLSTELRDAGLATVFTIHNMGYTHAVSTAEFWRMTRLTNDQYPGLYDWKERGILHHDKVDMLKAGIVRADMVNTVSPTYAAEIQTSAYGSGYAETLRWIAKEGQLVGILNGIDSMWTPSESGDAFFEKKREAKRQIQEIFDLPRDEHVMLAVMTSRMVYQKGYQLLPEAIAWLRRRPFRMQLVAAVDGDPALRDLFVGMNSPEIAVRLRDYNESLTRLVIYPGADALLMPSVYEPCGLSQIIAQKNGTLPIVYFTGGLKDTVKEQETGFVFRRYQATELAQAIERAKKMFTDDPAQWRQLQTQAMALDYSWKRSAEAYVELYREAVRRQKGQGSHRDGLRKPKSRRASSVARAR